MIKAITLYDDTAAGTGDAQTIYVGTDLDEPVEFAYTITKDTGDDLSIEGSVDGTNFAVVVDGTGSETSLAGSFRGPWKALRYVKVGTVAAKAIVAVRKERARFI